MEVLAGGYKLIGNAIVIDPVLKKITVEGGDKAAVVYKLSNNGKHSVIINSGRRIQFDLSTGKYIVVASR